MEKSYKLSREFIGHTDEILSLAIFKDGSIVSTSKDKTARFWKVKDNGNYSEPIVMKGHEGSISSVCAIEPTEKNPTGFIVTGSTDKKVCVYYPGSEEPIHITKAHDRTVYAVSSSFFEKDSFFTCSSDNTGKLWDLYDLSKPEATFQGHATDTTIRCIADLLNGSVVTGGSDKAVVIYLRSGKMLHKLNGHRGSINDIATVSHNEFLTCSNDGETKHWHAISAACLGTYSGHAGHIYNISAMLGGGLAVSCGQDRTIRVWCNAHADQIIGIPAENVRCVRLLPNKDIVCGSSDNVVRIFTADPERYADKESIRKYEKNVLESITTFAKLNQNKTIEQKKVSKKSNVARVSELNQPGKKDGDTVIVNVNDEVRAYKWSAAEFQWKFVGDVMETEAKASGKPKFEGVEYDYVFSVDVEKGAPLLKLPYNIGQDPYDAALKFIERNHLCKDDLQKIADFIMTNLQISPFLNSGAQYRDPFVGVSRYIPSTSRGNDSRASSSSSSRSTPPTIGNTNYIPQTYYLKLEQGNISAINEKLKEFNTKDENRDQSLSAEKLESLIKLISTENPTATEEEINNLFLLLNWPDDIVFPVLDVARLAVLKQSVNEKFCTNGISNVIKRHIQKDAKVSNQMLTFRLLANLFSHEAGERFCLSCKDEVLTALYELSEFGNKHNEVAISTYILNLVVALNKSNDSLGKLQTLSIIFKLLEILKETEAIFRTLIGLGTLILSASNADERKLFISTIKQSRPLLQALRILLNDVESSNVPNKLLSLTRQILELIRQ